MANLKKDRGAVDAAQSNQQARSTWERKAVGGHRATASSGSRAYFDQIRAYRYGYETPFIPRFFDFEGLSGKRVLEIGVGNGIDAVEMLKNGAEYSGIDITLSHLALTKTYTDFVALEVPGNVEAILEGDLLETSVSGNYDVIYSFGVLHHIAHESLFLKKISSLLSNQGELRIGVYSKYSFFNLWLVVTWLVKNRLKNSLVDWKSHLAEGSDLNEPVVIKIRSKKAVLELLKDSGYEVVRYEKKGFVQGYIPIIGRFLGPDGPVLNGLGSLLGWYHCFVCKKNEAQKLPLGVRKSP